MTAITTNNSLASNCWVKMAEERVRLYSDLKNMNSPSGPQVWISDV